MKASKEIAQINHKGHAFLNVVKERGLLMSVFSGSRIPRSVYLNQALGHFLTFSNSWGQDWHLTPADPKLLDMHMSEGKLGPHQHMKFVSN